MDTDVSSFSMTGHISSWSHRKGEDRNGGNNVSC